MAPSGMAPCGCVGESNEGLGGRFFTEPEEQHSKFSKEKSYQNREHHTAYHSRYLQG